MPIQSIRVQRYDYLSGKTQAVEYVKVDNAWQVCEAKFFTHTYFMPSLTVFV